MARTCPALGGREVKVISVRFCSHIDWTQALHEAQQRNSSTGLSR